MLSPSFKLSTTQLIALLVVETGISPDQAQALDLDLVEALLEQAFKKHERQLGIVRWLASVIVNVSGKSVKHPMKPRELLKLSEDKELDEVKKQIWRNRQKLS